MVEAISNLVKIAMHRPEYAPFILALPVLALSFMTAIAMAFSLNPKFDPILKEKTITRLRLGLIMHFSLSVVRAVYYGFMLCFPVFFQRKFPEMDLRDLRKHASCYDIGLSWIQTATHFYLWLVLVPWIIWAKLTRMF